MNTNFDRLKLSALGMAALVNFFLLSPSAQAQNVFPSSGFVGIGVSNPSYPLVVAPGGLLSSVEIVPQGWAPSAVSQLIMGDPNHVIKTTWGVGTQIYDVNSISMMGSNVGIGVTNPGYPLVVAPSGSVSSVQIVPQGWAPSAVSQLIMGDPNHVIKTTWGVGTQIYDVNSISMMGSNVGIGIKNPVTALDVGGGIRAGSQTAVTTCNSNTEGTQRYNYGSHNMEFCNGTGWTAMCTQ